MVKCSPATVALVAVLFGAAVSAQPTPPPDSTRERLAAAEQAWLDAYSANDREALAHILADEFALVLPDGTVATRDEVIGGRDLGGEFEGVPTRYTESRIIRVVGDWMAVVSGTYASPRDARRPNERVGYTDTWVRRDGRWRLLASHLTWADGQIARGGLLLLTDRATYAPGDSIALTVVNASDRQLAYDLCMGELQRQTEEGWNVVPRPVYEHPAYVIDCDLDLLGLHPGRRRSTSYRLNQYLSAGMYRWCGRQHEVYNLRVRGFGFFCSLPFGIDP
jgi:ketosteroid isomerase-like protein